MIYECAGLRNVTFCQQGNFMEPPNSPWWTMLRIFGTILPNWYYIRRGVMHRKMLSYFFALAFATGAFLAHAETYTATNVVVAPLTDAHWTQGAPYNDYSPKGTTVFTSGWEAGCVATAAAQELYYWQWPWRLGAVHETSHPVLNESNLSLRFDGNVPFDWESMQNSYGDGATLKQKHAAARLVLACQSLVQMQFVSAGGLASKNLPGTMEWFEYAGQVTPRASDTNLAALQADMEFGSPVQTGINFKGYGGHEVVGLGYATGTNTVGDAKNLIWLNLGWGGGSDGWYDLAEATEGETIIKSVQLGFRPIKSVQIEPVAPVSGNSVTLNWHLPNCYTNKITGFTVEKKKLATATTTWSDDFSTAKGRSSNTNEVRIVNGALKAWDGTASGMYIWDEVFEPTADSVLSYDVGSSYMNGMSVRFEAKVDGVWQSFHAVNVNGGKEINYYNWGTTTAADPVSLASLAGKKIQLRFVVEYTTGGIFTSDDASMKIDNLSVSNVMTFETVSTDSTIAASARSTTFSGLTTGDTYAFTVAPVMSDGTPAVVQTVTTTIGTPAATPVINAVTMSPKGVDLVQEGFYADIAMGWNIIDVACSESVTSLEAFISHQSVLPQSKIEVVDNGSGSFSINIDATEVAAKWAGQRMILTLKATNETGETTYKDLELRLVASGVPENVPGGKVWTGEDGFFGENYTAKWANNDLPSNGDKATFYVADGDYGAMMNLNLTSATELGYVNATGLGQLTISGSSSETLTIDTLKNDVQVEVNSTKLKVKKAVPSANIVIDSGSSLDCEIDQSRYDYIKKVNNGYVSALTDSSLWKGTVVFEGYSADTLNLNNYGNDNSRVLLNGVSGWLSYNTTVNPTVELVDSGTTPALHWNNGSGSSVSTFKSLVGTGTFKTSTPSKGGNERLKITSLEGFGGSFDLASKTVVIGSDVGTYTNNGRMNVNSGKDVTIASGKTWTIGGGMYLGGNQTITVNGTLNGAIAAEGTGTTLALKPTSAVTAASLNMANNTISIEKSADAASAVTVSGAVNLTDATVTLNLTGEPGNAVALMSAGSFTGVESASLTGLDDYELAVEEGVLYAKSLNPSYDGPEPIATWVSWEFEDDASDHGGYSIATNAFNTIDANGNILIGASATLGATIELPENAYTQATVLVKFELPKAGAPVANGSIAGVISSDNNPIGAYCASADGTSLTGYWLNSNGEIQLGSSGYNFSTAPATSAGEGYMLFAYCSEKANPMSKGTALYMGSSIETLVGGNVSGLQWKGNELNKFAIGGPVADGNAKPWSGMVVKGVALFVDKWLTPGDIAGYEFPEPEEPTTGANLVNGETVTYSDSIEGAIFPGLYMALNNKPTNPDAYVQVLDQNAETPNDYADYGIAYDSVNRRYCKAVAKIGSAGYVSLTDAWTAAGTGADTATITILSDPSNSDSVTVGAGQTLKVIAGSADLSDNVSFAAGLMTYTTTSGGVTTYTARTKGTTLPGIDTNVPMTVGDFALDSTGEWAEIVNAPIRMTLASSVRRFKLSFEVDIPEGVYGTLFSWDSTNSTEAVDSRVVITNDASKMVIYRNKNGVLSTVDYSESTLITSGQHTITVTWVHNTGCTIYVDGNKCYSSSSLAFTDHDTTTLAIGGSVLGGPVDAIAGLKVRNFTYNVYTDAVTLLDGTIYHGNDENRAVITNYLSQMVGHRPVKMPAPNTVDLLIVYDKPSAEFILDAGQTLEEHAAVRIARMNRILTTTDIDTNVWFRLAGVYTLNVAAPSVYAAMDLVRIGTAEGWTEVSEVRDSVGADVVLAVAHEHDADGYARWCNPEGIRNGSAAAWAFAGVHHGYDEGIGWAWVHEVGHLASLYHNMSAAADENNPNYIGCGFGKTTEADDVWVSSIMNYGTGQLAFSSKNHMSHGEIYSVTNGVGEYLDSTGVLAELLPCMANYRDTKVNAWSVTPQSGSAVTAGDTMTVTCEDPDATIWYSLYGEEDAQYEGPVAINTSSIYSIYNVTIKKGDEEVVTTQIVYYPDQTQVDPVARIDGGNGYDSLQAAIDAAESGAAIILLKSSGEAITLNKTIVFSEGENATFSGTFTGSGTLKLGAFLKNSKGQSGVSPLAAGWTGTVELTFAFAASGLATPLARYGNVNSTIKLTGGMTGGWLANVALDTTIELVGNMTLPDFSTSFANTIKKLTGTGTFSVTYSTTPDLTYPGYYPYYLIRDVGDFEGSLVIPENGTIGIVVGTNSKPSDKTHGGKILVYTNVVASANWTAPNGIVLADAAATLTVKDGVTVTTEPAVSTTVEDSYVKVTAVEGGTRYEVAENETVTNTDYPVPYSWIELYMPGISGYPAVMYDTVANSSGDNGYTYWESYVLGLDPTNATSRFVTTIRMEEQTPVVEYSPTNTALKLQYILQGKPALTNEWQDVDFGEPGDTNRFFRVKVKW